MVWTIYSDSEFYRRIFDGNITDDFEFNQIFISKINKSIIKINEISDTEEIIDLYSIQFYGFVVSISSIIALYILYKLYANRPIDMKLNNGKNKYMDIVKKNISIDKGIDIRVSEETLSYGKTIYLTTLDFVKIKKNKIDESLSFKISHEMFHMKTYDTYLMQFSVVISHINALFLSFFISFIIAITISRQVDESISLYIYRSVFVIFSYVLFKIYMIPLVIINKNKEFMADLYATKNDIKYPIYNSKQDSYHPDENARKNFILTGSNNELLYIIPVMIFFWWFYNIGIINVGNGYTNIIYIANSIVTLVFFSLLFLYKYEYKIMLFISFVPVLIISIIIPMYVSYYISSILLN